MARILLLCTTLLLVVFIVATCSRVYSASRRPNVLFVTIDTLRADHLGCYGYQRDTSPRIDELAREGVMFSQGIVQWPKTTPSFASMLTGTYGFYNGVTRSVRQSVSGHFDMLAEVLREAGYETVGVVTNPNLARFYHFDQGFETYIEGWRDLRWTTADEVTNYAVDWLQQRSGDESRHKPFLMWLHYIDPHSPYSPPKEYRRRYMNDRFYGGVQTADLNSGDWQGIGGIPRVVQVEDPQSPGETQDVIDYYVALYDAEIRYMDASIGKLLDAVKELGFEDDTLVVLTADHGESLGEHNYFFEHGVLPYDACSRVPLIVKVPGLKTRASVFDEPVELINVMPTILDAVGVACPEEVQGTSLVPFMSNDEGALPRYAFTESGNEQDYQRVVRRDHWKLIFVPSPADQKIMSGVPLELYDVENDPHETRNLIDVETEVADELQQVLFDWIATNKLASHAAPGGEVPIDEKTEAALRELGYSK